jgi:predicted CXXCH cytochrome family protein
MDVLLRQVRQAADGAVEYQDTEVNADTVSVGAAADCTIQLLGEGVGAHHATIRGGRGKVSIACHRRCHALINGVSSAAAKLTIGDVVDIGGHHLRLVEPPAGFDIAIEIEPNAQAATSQYERAFRTDLSETWLSKRGAAWLLVVLVLTAGLLIPYGSISVQHADGSLPAFMPTDRLWTAGPLIPAHELVAGRQCSRCHEQVFVHVRDSACLECHKSIADHVARAELVQTTLGPPQRCAQCHQEHQAASAGLIVRDNQLCVDCHARSESEFGTLKVMPVTGFALKEHPAFTVSLVTPAAAPGASGQTAVQTDWVVRRESVASAREQSNLKFSHAQHLDSARVKRLSDRGTLGCSDCHTLEVDGEHFIPVTMQRTCESCHELTFDPDAPDRQLPHGKPRDAILLIQDYYARKALDPNPTPSMFQRRRLPDQAEEEPITCSGPVFARAMCLAQVEIENQFKTRNCAGCHNVSEDTHSSGILDRFVVAPVRLTRDYFPDVHFSHRAHAVQDDKSGDAACLACHAVKSSKSSADVFIPDLPKCLECHSERLQKKRVTLQCADCHSYHPTSIIARNREAGVQ